MYGRGVLGALVAATAVMAWPATALAASDPALVEAAKQEGSLVVYGCDPGQTPVYLDRFKELYPEIEVTSYLAGCWQIYNRHVSERDARRQVADVFFSLEDVLNRMQNEDLLEDYHSPELANFPDFAAPEGKSFQRVKVLILGMAANRDHTQGMTVPKDWFDFAEPQDAWRDMATFYDPRTSSAAFSLLAALYQNFGPDRAGDIYRGLVAARAELAPTTPAGMSKLLSGEKPLMFYIVNNHYSGAVANGAPIDFIVPESGTVALPFSVSVLEGAPNSAAARLFTDFMMSEVQTIVQNANEYALINGARPPEGMPDLGEIDLLELDVTAALEQQEALIEWWQQTTGIR